MWRPCASRLKCAPCSGSYILINKGPKSTLRGKVKMSQPPSIAKTNQSVVTRDETAAATAMKRDTLHSIDAAGFLESAPDAMVIVDEQGWIVAVNTLSEQLFGYRREELIGELVEMLVTDRSRNRFSEL